MFNICTGKGITVRALADTMASLYRTELVPIYRPARAGEVRVSIGDPRLAATKLGFRAVTTLADGLAVTLDLPECALDCWAEVLPGQDSVDHLAAQAVG